MTTRVLTTAVEPDGTTRDQRLSGHDPDVQIQRSEAARDADRILYSPAWRRLAGVTQVVTPFEGQATLHNRLTHSEKVAQVSKAIALRLLGDTKQHRLLRRLGGLSADACEAAGLAHDIGHPPFGHIGEQVLDEIARDPDVLDLRDGFEGNAQTVRNLTTRRIRSELYEGLDLTRATLAAVLKYPWTRADRKPDGKHEAALRGAGADDKRYQKHWSKFSVYDSDAGILTAARRFLPVDFVDEAQTLEASIMDIADDITYAVHDLEDFYISGTLNVLQIIQDLEQYAARPNKPDPLNPFGKLVTGLVEDYPSWADTFHFVRAVSVARTVFAFAAEVTSETEAGVRARLSDQISQLLASVEVADAPYWSGGPYVTLGKPEWHVVQILKEVTKRYVIADPDVAILQVGQRTVLTELVTMMQAWGRRDRARLPRVLREELRIAEELEGRPDDVGYGPGRFAPRGGVNRAYLDYLCLLTDAQCLSLHEKLSGRRPHRTVVASGY